MKTVCDEDCDDEDCDEDLLAGQVGDVDEGVVEGGEDVTHSKHVLSFRHLRTQTDDLLLLLLLPFTRSHCLMKRRESHEEKQQLMTSL